jgi:hypothetical protein
MHFYSKLDKIQIRVEGTATLHADDTLADLQWENSPLSSRRCYLAEPGPGSESAGPVSGIPGSIEGRVPTEEEAEGGRKNFCAVKIKVHKIDWLYLSSSGHIRAEFKLKDGKVNAGWIIP